MRRWVIVLLCVFMVGCAELMAVEQTVVAFVRTSGVAGLDNAVLYVCKAARTGAVTQKYPKGDARDAYDAFCEQSK